MSIGGDFDPHRWDRAGLVVQGAVGPFDRLFEAPRGEMSDSDDNGADKGILERTQTVRPFDGFDRRFGLVAIRVDMPSAQPGVRRVRIEGQGAVESRRRRLCLAGQEIQRPRSLVNRFSVIAPGFERLSGKAAGFGDVVSGQCASASKPLQPPAEADQSRCRRVGRIDRQRLSGKDDCLG